MESEQELKRLVNIFFDEYLNRIEETAEGQQFSPISLRCYKSSLLEPMHDLLNQMAKLSGTKIKVTYEL